MPERQAIVPLTLEDLELVTRWAASEGWNPGLGDLAAAHALDPEGFLGIRRDGELIASLSAVRLSERFGFLGLFIVKEPLRGDGIGGDLFRQGIERLEARLGPDASIGMDGVFDVVPWYSSLGFALSHRDLRFEGEPTGAAGERVELLDGKVIAPLIAELAAFDSLHVEEPRPAFLQAWLGMPGVVAGCIRSGGQIEAFGALRPCVMGHKVGPLYSRSPDAARELLLGLIDAAGAGFVQVDVPELNKAGVDMATDLGLIESFGCARMYRGAMPAVPWADVYGVTSFEFG